MGKTIRIRLAFQSEKPVSFWFRKAYYFVNPGPKWTMLDHEVASELKRQFPTWLELYTKKPATNGETAQS
ncbi:hypothetical protein [Dyadobacter sp. OTU695]|uniref:hypothetical protein n=1 Tax=Dyadobacter sp. OTU695 TaxID=3043860 RepID=UPI00313DF1DA